MGNAAERILTGGRTLEAHNPDGAIYQQRRTAQLRSRPENLGCGTWEGSFLEFDDVGSRIPGGETNDVARANLCGRRLEFSASGTA